MRRSSRSASSTTSGPGPPKDRSTRSRSCEPKACSSGTSDGKRYLDFNSMVMCSNIGHGDQRVIEAMVGTGPRAVFRRPRDGHRARGPSSARLLAEITPGDLDRFLYTLGGADANEHAIKLARAYTGRHKILARYRSYHGATAGAIAATGDPRRLAWEPGLMPGVVHFLDPYRYRSAFHPPGADSTKRDSPRTISTTWRRSSRWRGRRRSPPCCSRPSPARMG